jgi:hypothetical protein
MNFAMTAYEQQAKTLRIKGYWRKNKQRHLNDVNSLTNYKKDNCDKQQKSIICMFCRLP